jgi:hypothetical protein
MNIKNRTSKKTEGKGRNRSNLGGNRRNSSLLYHEKVKKMITDGRTDGRTETYQLSELEYLLPRCRSCRCPLGPPESVSSVSHAGFLPWPVRAPHGAPAQQLVAERPHIALYFSHHSISPRAMPSPAVAAAEVWRVLSSCRRLAVSHNRTIREDFCSPGMGVPLWWRSTFHKPGTICS